MVRLVLFIKLLHDPRRCLIMCFLAVSGYHLWIRSSCFLCFRPNSTNIVIKQIIWALAVDAWIFKNIEIIKKMIPNFVVSVSIDESRFLKNFTCIYYKLISQSLMLKLPASSSCILLREDIPFPLVVHAHQYGLLLSFSVACVRSSTNKALIS